MFDDNRSKKVILVAHCLLNQNAISDGTADFPSQFREIVDLLMEHQVGIIQLPCPELQCLGLDRRDPSGGSRELLRENSRIRNLMTEKGCITRMRAEAAGIVTQIEEYQSRGFRILGLIGINRSPSCGIESTSRDGREEPGAGVFMEVITELFRSKGISLVTIGVKTSKVEESLEKVRNMIRNST